jgi:hypothetical protein
LGHPVGEGGELIEIPEQQEAVRTMSVLRGDSMSLRTIAAAVESRHGIKVSYAGVDQGARLAARDAGPP